MITYTNIGIILIIEVISLNWIISIIIITNKNRIAIAPTYIIIIIKGIKSNPKEIKNPEELKNIKTNQKIEWIGLKDIIHIIVENKINKEKKSNNWIICKKIILQEEVPFLPLCYDLLYF